MKIHFSNPYSTTKHIGEALNDFCRMIPDENDWIVLQDGDMMYLTPDWGRLIHDSLSNNGNEFGLIGCYTNRLRGLHQLHNNQISHDHEMRYHYNIAKQYANKDAKVNHIGQNGVAGVFMAFQKKTWIDVNGFNEISIAFDSDFNVKVRQKGLKLGLINNLYVYHWYRGWNDIDPANDISHLM